MTNLNLNSPWLYPLQGFGIGLRAEHIPDVLQSKPDVPWLEILSDNYFAQAGASLDAVLKLREDYPMAMHSVGLSIGSSSELDLNYLKQLKTLQRKVQPIIISDHLCWTSLNAHHVPDLLPLPLTDETLEHVATRVHYVQEYLKAPIALENVSSYLSFKHNDYTEWEFLNKLSFKTDCKILLDINNIYVSCINHDLSPKDYIDNINKKNTVQHHLAGFSQQNHFLLDSHSTPVHDEVWRLYAYAREVLGPIPGIIEWDNNIPELEVLLQERELAQAIFEKADAYEVS